MVYIRYSEKGRLTIMNRNIFILVLLDNYGNQILILTSKNEKIINTFLAFLCV